MIDKLDLEVPRTMPFKSDFAKYWNDEKNDRIFKKRTGGLYLVTGDLRGVGIPAMLSIGHKHHEKLGPKLEIIGAGSMTFSQWVDVHSVIFQGEAWEDNILRADLTADDIGVPVADYGRAMWCKNKHTNQQEYGEWDHKTTAVNRFAAQTLYYGRKPRQLRFYDKTRHRLQVLLPQIHRKQKHEGFELSTFEEAFGYQSNVIVTRAERQMGRRETGEAWGIHCLGEIHRLVNCDPFEKLQFAQDARGSMMFEELDGSRRSHIRFLRQQVREEGIDAVKAMLLGDFDKANSFRKFWRENEHLILEANPLVSKEKLTNQYRHSILEQLAA
jgi:hypothetical protein